MDETIDRLKDLIEKRKNRERQSSGEIFILWGFIVLAGYLVSRFLILSGFVILAALAAGIVFQVLFLKRKREKAGFTMIWKNNLNYLWIFIVILMVVTGGFFPAVIKLYSSTAGSAIIFFLCAAGIFISGLLLRKWSIGIGSIVFIIAAVFMALPFPGDKSFVIIPALVLGMIVPGIICLVTDKYQSGAI
jgi:FtsH-binding integral membrane protein